MAVSLLSFTPSSSLDAQRTEENNKGFFLRMDNLSPRCLPDYTTVILLSVVILHRPMIVALFLRQSVKKSKEILDPWLINLNKNTNLFERAVNSQDSILNSDVDLLAATAAQHLAKHAGLRNLDGEKVLIMRLTTQKWLDVDPDWTVDDFASAHSRIEYEYRVTCAPHYYGKGCEDLCRPRDDNFGHYSCSPSGERVCLTGWKGDYCNTPRCLPGCDEQHGHCNRPNECM
ncbi:PREDICTED: neurogenic locus protein delta-like [Atta cephalotes]|uniref:Delta-like protein n=1 Tax=Atta cephalotes TaxID=12957 RepID=A0A158NEE0_ATTCE|nr:PREDICTED: neurogenic locus protein delta-like [Atta cephalotes]